jgi:thiol:disulfide interchange protein DsbC
VRKNIFIKSSILGVLLSTSIFAQNIDSDLKTKIKNLPILKQAKGLKVLKIMALNETDYLVRVNVNGRDSEFIVLDNLKQIVFSKARSPITSKEISFPVDMSILKGNDGFTVGTGKKELHIFTDPDCPYCHKLEDVLSTLDLEKDYKFSVYFLPLERIHPKAKAKVLYILSAKTDKQRYQRMVDLKEGKISLEKVQKYKPTKEAIDLLKTNIKLSSQFGVSGTPTVFDKSGSKINWSTLK